MVESKPQNLIEELKARNIELTIQNKELQLAKDKAEIAAQKLNLLCDLSLVGYFIIDCRGKIVEFNSSGLSLLGKTDDELLNYTFSQFITKKKLPDFNIFLLKAKETNAENFCVTELTINQEKNVIVHLTVRFLEKEQQYLITTLEIIKKSLQKIFLWKRSLFLKKFKELETLALFNLTYLIILWSFL
jgi:PAS domain S-box-containing protein